MPEFTVIQLKPRSAFLLGRRGVGQEVSGDHLPADTLFAALMAAEAEWGGQPERWLAGFPTSGGEAARPARGEELPFLLTSAFPFAGGVRFYPKPMLPFDVGDQSKPFKKVRFVSERLFRQMLAGEPPERWLPPDEKQGTRSTSTAELQHGKLWLTAEECAQLPDALRFVRSAAGQGKEGSPRALREMSVYAVDKVPRVTVDRIRHASEIYHTGRLSFAPGCGLWFGVQWKRPDAPFFGGRPYRDVFLDMLAFLGDQGIGGERSAGYGAFEAVEGAALLRFDDPAPGGLFVTLSRYHPRPDELPGTLSGDGVAYQLETVGGWLKSFGVTTQRRRQVWMCAEGSICRAIGDGPWGDVVDVQPRYEKVISDMHPVWRYGLACAIGIGGGQ